MEPCRKCYTERCQVDEFCWRSYRALWWWKRREGEWPRNELIYDKGSSKQRGRPAMKLRETVSQYEARLRNAESPPPDEEGGLMEPGED